MPARSTVADTTVAITISGAIMFRIWSAHPDVASNPSEAALAITSAFYTLSVFTATSTCETGAVIAIETRFTLACALFCVALAMTGALWSFVQLCTL
jgi:hypothetical protein